VSDLSLLGGPGGVLYQPDALENYAQSAEAGTGGVIRTKAYAPIGWNGEVVFRRLILTAQYDSQIALTVRFYLDGRLIPEVTATLSRASGPERYTWVVPLARSLGNGMVGPVRGTSMQLEVTASSPSARWYLNPVEVQYAPAVQHRRSG
jgi:hypothetical protein